MKTISLAIALLFATHIAANPIDSLRRILETAPTDSTQYYAYTELASEYMFVNIDSTRYFGELAVNQAKKMKSLTLEKNALVKLGHCHYNVGKFEESFKYFTEILSLPRYPTDSVVTVHIINYLGLANWKLNRDDLAIKNFQEVFELSKVLKDNDLYKYSLNNIGLVNESQGRSEVALKYFNKLRQFAIENDDEDALSLTYINLGNTYTSLKRYPEAEIELKKYLEIAKRKNNHTEIANVYNHLARVYLLQKNNKKALSIIDKAEKVSLKHNIRDMLTDTYFTKSEIFIAQQLYKKAIRTALKGKEISLDINYRISGFYKLLAEAYHKDKQYKDAFLSQKKHYHIQDSLMVTEKEKEIAFLEVSFQSKEKASENALLIKEKKIRQSKLKQKSLIIGMISIVTGLLFAVVSLLFLSVKKDRKIKTYLEEEVEKRTHELNLINNQLIQSNEELKRFAYIASHDLREPLRNISGFISLIKRRGDNLSKEDFDEYFSFIENSNLQMAELVNSILQYSNLDATKEAKKEIIDLSQILDQVKTLLMGTIRERNVQIIYKDLPVIEYYPYVIKTVLKNLIENGLKYNEEETPTIQISSKYENDRLYLFIKDNGIGIDPEFHHKIFDMFTRLNSRKTYTGSGMGLAFCKKMLQKYQGSIELSETTKAGNGSTFIITLETEIKNVKTDILTER